MATRLSCIVPLMPPAASSPTPSSSTQTHGMSPCRAELAVAVNATQSMAQNKVVLMAHATDCLDKE